MTIDKLNIYYQTTPRAIPEDGWMPLFDTGYLWTRTGNHTFTFTRSDNYISEYRRGTRVRYKENGVGSYEYGVIVTGSAVFTGGSYLHTINLMPNSDYLLPAVNTITDMWLSPIENPYEFPIWFNYTTSASRSGGAYGNAPTINIAKWRATYLSIEVVVRATMHATPGSSGFQIYTLPWAPVSSSMGIGMNVSSVYSMAAIMLNNGGTGELRGWKYDSTAEAVGSAVYHYNGFFQY